SQRGLTSNVGLSALIVVQSVLGRCCCRFMVLMIDVNIKLNNRNQLSCRIFLLHLEMQLPLDGIVRIADLVELQNYLTVAGRRIYFQGDTDGFTGHVLSSSCTRSVQS